MEQKASLESSKFAFDLKCEKVLETVDQSITCPTPQKNAESLTLQSREEHPHIPEKYYVLVDFFGAMCCSLRLLHLRKRAPTFLNICSKVEVISKRKFSHAHLAQIKYVLPEIVCIDKVLVHDKKSLCMVPDMNITLKFEVLKDRCDKSANLAVLRHFKSMLTDFLDKHPEVVDIPEALLPEPFGKKTCSLKCEVSHVEKFIGQSLDVNSSMELSSISSQTKVLPEKFQLYQTLSGHSSQKNLDQGEKTEKTDCFPLTKTSPSFRSSDSLDNGGSEKAQQKEFSPISDHMANLNTERGDQTEELFSMSFQPGVTNTPVHTIRPQHSVTCTKSESPDMKNICCVADSFMTETPAQSAPLRLLPMSDVKCHDVPTQKSASSHKPAKRVLDFSLMGDNDEDCNSSGSVSVPQEAEESLGYSFKKTSQKQAGLDTRHNNKSSPLLDLVNVIQSIFQSVQRMPITKEELLHKILMNSLDFVEIREVEEQVESLERLVPDWICKKLLPAGDTMYCINKVSDVEYIRTRLSNNEIV